MSDEGVVTDPEKVSAVREWPTPHMPTVMRSFPGLCSHYPRFVKGFASVASPLYRLMDRLSRGQRNVMLSSSAC